MEPPEFKNYTEEEWKAYEDSIVKDTEDTTNTENETEEKTVDTNMRFEAIENSLKDIKETMTSINIKMSIMNEKIASVKTEEQTETVDEETVEKAINDFKEQISSFEI